MMIRICLRTGRRSGSKEMSRCRRKRDGSVGMVFINDSFFVRIVFALFFVSGIRRRRRRRISSVWNRAGRRGRR